MADQTKKCLADLPRVVALTTGTVTLLTAGFGAFLSSKALIVLIAGGYPESLRQYDLPYFHSASYLMLAVSILCCLILAWCGIDQVRLKLAHLKLFVGLFVFEVLYALFLGRILWRSPELGMSVGAATGPAMNGLIPPFVVLLPFWAPFALSWAKKRLLVDQHQPFAAPPAARSEFQEAKRIEPETRPRKKS